MKRITLDVPRWHAYQHREARAIATIDKNDSRRLQFEDELFDKLYSSETEEIPQEDREPELSVWAEQVHKSCTDLPAFKRLCRETLRNAPLSGAAVDSIMQELGPMLDEQEKKEEEAKKNQQPGDEPAPPKIDQKALRRAVSKATQAAAKDVETLKDAMDGLDQVYQPGSEVGQHTKNSGEQVRKLAQMLKRNAKLQHIAKLVGRFRRVAANKAKQKVKHGVDEITDIVAGDDIGRLLPTELSRLAHPIRKLSFMRDLYERRLLQYQMQAQETKVRGPMVVAIDKSGSMNGEPDAWATAVALALCDIAHRERRTFALLSFDTRVMHECVVKPGEPVPEQVLFIDANGGTDIDIAYARALEIIEQNPGQLNKADIVLITDGGSFERNTKALRERAANSGVQTFGIGIGVPAECLNPWCDYVTTVNDIHNLDDKLATKLFG